jgi:cytochrome c-type biogenesis protein CcmF
MTVAHSGLGIAVLALTCVGSFTTEQDIALAQGASAQVGGYEFRLDGLARVEGPNYEGLRGTVTVTRGGKPLTVMHPEKRRYWVQQQTTTNSAIETHGGSNILVGLGDNLGAGRWSLRVQIRPLVNLLWLGALIMAVGGGLAASDRRYRTAKEVPAEEPVTGSAPAGSALR